MLRFIFPDAKMKTNASLLIKMYVRNIRSTFLPEFAEVSRANSIVNVSSTMSCSVKSRMSVVVSSLQSL
jgi:hypothetical protein